MDTIIRKSDKLTFNPKTMRVIKYMLRLSSVALLFFASLSCKQSPVGTYRADLTIVQSGHYTTIVIKQNGTADIIEKGDDTIHTYWEYAGKGIDVRVKPVPFWGYWYFLDFDEGNIYYGADDYRSCQNGHRFSRVN